MMLYTKYESSRPCSFGQDDFWKLHFKKTYFLTLWPTYATNWNSLNNFDRGPPRDHFCEVWSKSNKWFQRRFCLKKLLTLARTDGRTDGRWTTDNGPSQKLDLSTLCSGELKINRRRHCEKIAELIISTRSHTYKGSWPDIIIKWCVLSIIEWTL